MQNYLTLNRLSLCDPENINLWVTDNRLESLSLKTLTIGELLASNHSQIYILQDIHNRLIELNNQPWNTELYQPMPRLLEKLTILQCEAFYRWQTNEMADKVADRYPSLTSTGFFHIASLYGWILPYFIDYADYADELAELPTIDINLRPSTKDNLIHPLPLHSVHSILATYEKIYIQFTIDELNASHTPAHIKANKARTAIYDEHHTRLFELLKKELPSYEKQGIKSTKKQAVKLFFNHRASIGYEFSTLENKINEYKKAHK